MQVISILLPQYITCICHALLYATPRIITNMKLAIFYRLLLKILKQNATVSSTLCTNSKRPMPKYAFFELFGIYCISNNSKLHI